MMNEIAAVTSKAAAVQRYPFRQFVLNVTLCGDAAYDVYVCCRAGQHASRTLHCSTHRYGRRLA
eukprot:2271755-Amphidinium_carterae.1